MASRAKLSVVVGDGCDNLQYEKMRSVADELSEFGTRTRQWTGRLSRRIDSRAAPLSAPLAWNYSAVDMLARGRRWRGTAFGRTADRRLVADYRPTVEEVVEGLDAANRDAATALLDWPRTVRGFGPVKAKKAERALVRREELAAIRAAGPAGRVLTAAR